MAFDFSLIIANPIYLATLGLATCGWIILMAGCAAAKLTDVVWFIVMYHLFLIIAVTTAIATNSIRQYRLALLAFMTAGFALLVPQVDLALKAANLQSTASRFIATTAPALQAASAGGMFILMVLCVWMIIFGSEDDSYIGRTINSFSISKSTVTYPPNNGGSGLPASNGVVSQSQQSSFVPGVAQVQQPVQENLSTVVVSPNADYPYKAQALYEYQANPDDQNELSFAKGEVLDIADNKGKWWQARKADGSIGIAPSNYLQLI